MASFDELFPSDPLAKPFQPVAVGKVSSRLKGIRARALEVTDLNAGPEMPPAEFLQMPSGASMSGETDWADYGKSIMSGIGDIGSAVAGAGEYAAGQAGLEGTQEQFGSARRDAQAFSENWAASMTPEAQDRAGRELLSLDPNKTMWQGGAGEFLSSIGLKFSRSIPSSAVTLLPGALMLRAGLGAGAISYLGASEGGLSLGSIAANIAQEVEQAPIEELMKAPQFAEMVNGGMDETEARQRLIAQAQGLAPVVGGLVVGAISAAAGRYLAPVFTDKAGGFLARAGRGYLSEAGQEAGQSGAEQVAQNYAAQLFDTDRSLGEGVAEASAQGAMVGGLMGGGMAAVLGQRPRRALDVAGTPATPEEVQPPAAPPLDPAIVAAIRASQAQDDMPVSGMQTDPYTGQGLLLGNPGQESVLGETRGPTDVMTRGGRRMAIPPEPETPQANRRYDTTLPPASADMPLVNAGGAGWQAGVGPPRPPGPPPGGAPAGDMTQLWARNHTLDLTGGGEFSAEELALRERRASDAEAQGRRRQGIDPNFNTVAPQLPPGQQPLLRERVRGAQQAPLIPAAASPLVTDLSAPDAVAGAHPGTFRDENQQDMFAEDPALLADEPSAEPLSDLKAQLGDLSDPDHPRQGVYLSAANIDQLRTDGTFEQVRGVGVPLANFDGRGGTLVAKNRGVAQELLQLRDSGAANMQEILGLATGAGAGKPLDGNIAVQQRDEDDNVVRETLVGTPEEAQALAPEFEAPGRKVAITPAVEAIRRRNKLIRQESKQARASQEAKAVHRAVGYTIRKELGDTPLARQVSIHVGRRNLSENQAARKIAEHAGRMRRLEARDRLDDLDRPDKLDFSNVAPVPKQSQKDATEQAAAEYRELFDQYVTLATAEEMASTPDETSKARSEKEAIGQQLEALRRTTKATTPAERVARLARKVSPEEILKMEREGNTLFETLEEIQEELESNAFLSDERAAELRERFNSLMNRVRRLSRKGGRDSQEAEALRKKIMEIGDQDLTDLKGSELNVLFMEAARIMSGLRSSKDRLGRGEKKMFGGDTSQPYMLTREMAKRRKEPEKNKQGKVERPETYSKHAAVHERGMQQKAKLLPDTNDKENPLAWEAGATTTITPRGMTIDELVEAHPTPSDKQKLIARVQHHLRNREAGKDVGTALFTASAVERKAIAAEPTFTEKLRGLTNKDIDALTDAQLEAMQPSVVNFFHTTSMAMPADKKLALRKARDVVRDWAPPSKTKKADGTAITKGRFQPARAFDLNPPLEWGAAKMAAHNAKLAAAFAELSKRLDALAVYKPWTRDAKNEITAVYANAYRKTLLKYGYMLLQLRPRSVMGLKEVEKFISSIDKLQGKNIAEKLATMMRAESETQARAAVRVDPTHMVSMSLRTQRNALALEFNKDLLEQIEALARLHEKWQKNALFMSNVQPVMQKIIGYTTRDTTLGDLNYTVEMRQRSAPVSQQEMDGVTFALKSWSATETEREDLREPLKRWFKDAGLAVSDDYVVSVSEESLKRVMSDARDRGGFRYEEPQSEMLARQERAAERMRMNLTPAMRRKLLRKRPPPKWEIGMDEYLALGTEAATAQKEAQRRAALNPTQRRREDREAVAKVERARRKGMSYEQRKALASLDRQGRIHRLVLDEVLMDVPALREAARAVTNVMERGESVSLTAAVQTVSANLPDDHPYQPLLKRLAALSMDVQLQWSSREAAGGDESFAGYNAAARQINFAREAYEEQRIKGHDPSPYFIHALLHESVHAATAGALQNPALRQQLRSLMYEARANAKAQGVSLELGSGKEFYGFRENSVDEFVAEAFSNGLFQQVLEQITVGPQTLWGRIIDFVKNLLGMQTERTTALDAVLATTDSLFTGKVENLTEGMTQVLRITDDALRQPIGNIVDKIIQTNRVTKRAGNTATNLLGRSLEAGSRGILSAVTMEQLRDFYVNEFDGPVGPMHSYMKAFFQREANISENMEPADTLWHKWAKLIDQYKDKNIDLSHVMSEATLYGVHPDLPLSDEKNKHVVGKNRDRHQQLAQQFRALPPELQAQYHALRDYYRKAHQTELNLHTLNAIRGVLGGKNLKYTEADIHRLKLNTKKGLEAEFGDQLTDKQRTLITKLAQLAGLEEGPYFPLLRFGDYVVIASREVEKKTFATAKEARAYQNKVEGDDPTLTVNVKTNEAETESVVTVTEQEVRMAESPSEAAKNHRELLADYPGGKVTEPMLKLDNEYSREAAIGSMPELKTLLGQLEGNPGAQAALKEFYLRSLSDRAHRKREIGRSNRRGVNYDHQMRTFATYSKASAYYTAQLRFGWKMATALQEMNKYVRAVGDGEKTSNLSAIRLGEVVDEVRKRDRLTTDPTEVSRLVRAGTQITQLYMLASPSYWMINMTQPWMVSLPWLAAHSSIGDATSALVNAQRLIAHPLISQSVKSIGGLKALWSKSTAETSFSILDDVLKQIKDSKTPRATQYLEMLRHLKQHNIIDLTMQSELRDIAEGQKPGMIQRVMDASRIMSHLTEVNNRIMVAIAAYDLARNKGNKHEDAIGFAQRAVSNTQFNYSSGNTPRLFQARGPLGQAGPLVFQFMKYPQHMYALMISNMMKLVRGGQIDRKIARRTLLGLLTTHMAAGGVLGVMLQPIKWAIGMVLAMGDDEEDDWKGTLSGANFDRFARKSLYALFDNTDLAEAVGSGLPRLLGADVSSRMSLGTLYFLDFKTDSAESTLGSIISGFGGPALSLGMGFMRGASYMAEGQVAKGLEAFAPKAIKDLMKMYRYSSEGMTDATGKEVLGAEKLSPVDLFYQGLGIQPSLVAEKYAANAAERAAKSGDDAAKEHLKRRYMNADPDERADIWRDIVKHNARNPGAKITRSELLKSQRGFQKREAQMRRYGIALSGADTVYAEEAEAYDLD